jgi:D-aminopeptidase
LRDDTAKSKALRLGAASPHGWVTLGAGTSSLSDIRTGVTAILPHGENLFQARIPAGLAVGNGFGKLMGATQVVELGELETPIVLTNTLAVPRAADALLTYTLAQPANAAMRSVNPLVGECNDGFLNDMRSRVVMPDHVLAAIAAADGGPVPAGCVGAGVGVVAFGWKGGIGTSSRLLPAGLGGWTMGALVQANFGGVLQVDGLPVGRTLGRYYLKEQGSGLR